jgi:hypothetical protein
VPDVSKLASMKMTKDGEIKVHAKSDITVDADSNVTITIKGNANVKVEGNADIKVSKSTKLTSPDVTITGGKLTIKGQATPDMNGPFTCVKSCIFSGAPHSGSVTTT